MTSYKNKTILPLLGTHKTILELHDVGVDLEQCLIEKLVAEKY